MDISEPNFNDIQSGIAQEQNSRPDFSIIQSDIDAEANECHLLYVKRNTLEERYNQGRSFVIRVEDKDVGNVSVTPLLDQKMKKRLGLSEDFPEIYEIGSVIVNEEYRNRRYSEEMLSALLRTELGLQDIGTVYSEEPPTLLFNSSQGQEHRANPVLFISTTKDVRFLKTELRVSEDLGLDYELVAHTAYSMIAPFTCVCTPEEGGGHGFQYGKHCEVMIENEELEVLSVNAAIKSGKTGCRCTMYVSDKELAGRIDADLREFFVNNEIGAQNALRERLIETGYYSSMSSD